MLALLAASGVALADNIDGNGANNRLVGTGGKDAISGAGGADDIFGRGAADRLFGDSGNDFVNAIDAQTNDRVDCGEGEFDVAGIDDFSIFSPLERADEVAPNCETVYVGIPIGIGGAASEGTRSDPGANLSAIDTRAEAERAEADGLLRQIR